MLKYRGLVDRRYGNGEGQLNWENKSGYWILLKIKYIRSYLFCMGLALQCYLSGREYILSIHFNLEYFRGIWINIIKYNLPASYVYIVQLWHGWSCIAEQRTRDRWDGDIEVNYFSVRLIIDSLIHLIFYLLVWTLDMIFCEDRIVLLCLQEGPSFQVCFDLVEDSE